MSGPRALYFIFYILYFYIYILYFFSVQPVIKEILQVFLNGLIPSIRLKPKIREHKINFPVTTVTMENGHLKKSPYSKPADSKQYLIPFSVHKENVTDNIPKTVGMRLKCVLQMRSADKELRRMYELRFKLKFNTKLNQI